MSEMPWFGNLPQFLFPKKVLGPFGKDSQSEEEFGGLPRTDATSRDLSVEGVSKASTETKVQVEEEEACRIFMRQILRKKGKTQ